MSKRDNGMVSNYQYQLCLWAETDLDFFNNLFAEGADFGGALKGHGGGTLVLRSDSKKGPCLIRIGKVQICPEFDQIERILGA